MDESARNMHYSRNRYNNPLPQSIDEAKTWGWDIEEADYCHQFGVPNISNVKYVPSEDGREQIFVSNDVVENSPKNIATHNFFHPQKHPILHGAFDVVPWVRYGNTPDDATKLYERIMKPLIYQYYAENVPNSDGSGITDK